MTKFNKLTKNKTKQPKLVFMGGELKSKTSGHDTINRRVIINHVRAFFNANKSDIRIEKPLDTYIPEKHT